MNYKDIFPKEKHPNLYSKRGFEKKRIKLIIPFDRNVIAYMYEVNVKIKNEL